MSCSILHKLTTDLRSKNLTNKDLEAPLSKERELTKYVLDMTKLVKKDYKVDMGNLFTMKKTDSKITLVPNTSAIEAIERSPELEQQEHQILTNEAQQGMDKNQLVQDVNNMGKPADTEPSKINVKGLPELQITC